MTSTQLLQAVGADLQTEIVHFLQTDQRAAYRAVVQNLAVARKLRPVFIQSKSKTQQAAWLLEQLRLKSNQDVTTQILQIWLMKGHPKLLVTFLDAVGIPHNGEGEVDELPEEISEEKAEAGIQALLASFPVSHAALYLNLFQYQRPGGWSGLTSALEKHPDLKLGS